MAAHLRPCVECSRSEGTGRTPGRRRRTLSSGPGGPGQTLAGLSKRGYRKHEQTRPNVPSARAPRRGFADTSVAIVGHAVSAGPRYNADAGRSLSCAPILSAKTGSQLSSTFSLWNQSEREIPLFWRYPARLNSNDVRIRAVKPGWRERNLRNASQRFSKTVLQAFADRAPSTGGADRGPHNARTTPIN